MLYTTIFALVICVISASTTSSNVVSKLRSHKKRIIDGKPINIEDAPYQVSVFDNVYKAHRCGGSIISPEYVLIAGHSAGDKPEEYKVRVGSSSAISGGKMHDVVEVIRHEDYGANWYGRVENDIGLLKVSPPFEIDNKTVKIVEMFGEYDDYKIGDDGYITGWGITETGKVSEQLRALTVKILRKGECHSLYSDLGGIDRNQFCATHPDGNRDFCTGDSGGPLLIDGRQAGIISWSGPGCAKSDRPGVYTNVAAYRYWIDKHIKTVPWYKKIYNKIFNKNNN